MHSTILLNELFLTLFAVTIAADIPSLSSESQSKQTSEENYQQVLKNQAPALNMYGVQCSDVDEGMKKEKVVKLNVDGVIVTSTRDILTRVHNSKLASMIHGNCEDIPALDSEGNIFLHYDPILFRHLLQQLRVLNNEDLPVFHPPHSRLMFTPFKQMLEDFGLQIAPLSNDDIITLNVGGDIVVTRRRILTRISHSQLARIVSSYERINTDANGYVFLDCDGRLFRHLLSQLRSSSCQQMCTFTAPSIEDHDAFQAMLITLGLTGSTANTTSLPPTHTQLTSQNAKITASSYCNAQKTSCTPPAAVAEQVKGILDPNKPTLNYWNSGGYAPQYVQLELQREQSISHVLLQVAQTPNGHTSHSLLVGSTENGLREVKALAGNTNKYEWINLTFHPPLENVRFLRINTISSPSWVAWFKFLVYNN